MPQNRQKSSDYYMIDGFKIADSAVFRSPEFFESGDSFPSKKPRQIFKSNPLNNKYLIE